MIDTREKIVSTEELTTTEGSTVVAIGRFDVIRSEHCQLLQNASSECDRLVAAVLSDTPEKASLLDHQARANLTAALGAVNHVVMCSADEAQVLSARVGASATLDIDSLQQRDVIADVLHRQSAGE